MCVSISHLCTTSQVTWILRATGNHAAESISLSRTSNMATWLIKSWHFSVHQSHFHKRLAIHISMLFFTVTTNMMHANFVLCENSRSQHCRPHGVTRWMSHGGVNIAMEPSRPCFRMMCVWNGSEIPRKPTGALKAKITSSVVPFSERFKLQKRWTVRRIIHKDHDSNLWNLCK